MIFEGYLTAQTPIHHGGDEKTGSESLLRRISYVIDGKRVEIPYVSGNSIRGILRRLLMSDMLIQLGYQLSSTKIYHMLFTGGILETVNVKDSGVINLELKKHIRENLVPIALLGTSLGNQIFEGKLKVGNAIPVCRELKDFLPDMVEPQLSIYELLDFSFATRLDDLREEREEGEQATQMLYSFEVFVPGTMFYHTFTLEKASQVEYSAFVRMLNLWKSRPYIGGKSAVGMGLIKIHHDYNEDDEKEYLEYLKSNRDNIISTIKELEGTWK